MVKVNRDLNVRHLPTKAVRQPRLARTDGSVGTCGTKTSLLSFAPWLSVYLYGQSARRHTSACPRRDVAEILGG